MPWHEKIAGTRRQGMARLWRDQGKRIEAASF
jgi:hypothetical protein